MSIDVKAIMLQVKANHERLRSCAQHRFPAFCDNMIGQRVICDHCCGDMLMRDVLHYVRGYRAAGGEPNDIVPNWTSYMKGRG